MGHNTQLNNKHSDQYMLQVFNGMILPIVFVELHPFSLAEDNLLKNVNELLKNQ